MRRRAVLTAGLGLGGLGFLGTASARSDVTGRAAFAPLGRRAIPGAADCRVSTDGETAFVATGDGFVAVSVATMAPIGAVRSIAADRDSGPLVGVADLAVDGDRLLVPGPANPRPGRIAGFALFDVAEPAAPNQVAFYETDFPIHNAALAGDRAYLTAGDALVVVDVGRDDPVEVRRWSLEDADAAWSDVHPALRTLHDVRVRGDLAVLSLWDAGTWLVDVADDDVSVVGRAGGQPPDELADIEDDDVRRAAIELPGNHHSAALTADGSLLAVGAEAFDTNAGDGEGGPGGIDLYDIADPSAPAHLAAIDAPPAADETHAGSWTTAHDFAFADDRLLSAWYQGGVRIHDVSDPTDPVELAWWRRPAEAAFWTARPAANDTFVASATTLPGGDLFSGLYRFPNRPGEQADPPSLTAPTSPTATPSPTATTAPTVTPTLTRSQTTSPGQSGFGLGTTLWAVAGLAAWTRYRNRD